MKYTEVKGDLLEEFKKGSFSVLVHGCNCFHTMGAGVAAQIKFNYWPAFLADCATPYGDKNKLGSFSYAEVGAEKYIVNLYSQFNFGKSGKRYLSYDALKSGLALINLRFLGKIIGLPRIGCGLAGGEWGIVKAIIKKTLVYCDVVVVTR